jgi:ABC-type uncharacterized transport system auxiliary subunit
MHRSRITLNVRPPSRLQPLAALFMVATLTACAGGSSNSQSGYGMAQAESAGRSGLEPFTATTPSDQRTLACLHCAP